MKGAKTLAIFCGRTMIRGAYYVPYCNVSQHNANNKDRKIQREKYHTQVWPIDNTGWSYDYGCIAHF